MVFGTYRARPTRSRPPDPYNDGDWHHVVASQAAGRHEALRGRRPERHQPPDRRHSPTTVTGRSAATPPGAPRAHYLDGTIDEAAVYSYVLSPQRVTAHFIAGGGVLNQTRSRPSPAPSTSVAPASTARPLPTRTAPSPATPGTSVTTQRAPARIRCTSTARPVTYTVKLTVTDNKGASAEVTHQVTVTAPAAPGDAYGAAVVADQPRLYWRLDETSGTAAADSSSGPAVRAPTATA